jgi:hypothetical protein
MQIRCEERYKEAMAYAEETNNNTLQNCLARLEQWEKNRDCEIILYYDRSPLSFYFEMNDKTGKRVMNGGLLYHGTPDESNAVTFDPTKGWQIHT